MDLSVTPHSDSPRHRWPAPRRWFYNYLNSGIPGGADIGVHYVNAITLIGILDMLASVFIELSIGNRPMAGFMLMMCLWAVLNTLRLRQTHNAARASSRVLLIMLTMFTVMLINGMFENTAPIWFATFPALAYFFKGKVTGSLWLAALLVLQLFVMLSQQAGLLHTPFSTAALGLILASTATIGMIVYVYESLRAEAENSLEEARKELHQMAHTDMLTGLPNRTAFYRQLPLLLNQADQNHRRAAVFFIDLDNFKPINDTYGHEVGDELLQQAASRLRKQLRASDFIARFGGDEFVAVLPEINREQDLGRIAEMATAALASPFHIQGHLCQISVSIGIGLYPDCASDPDSLVRLADHAMYSVKLGSKSGYAVCPVHSEHSPSAYKGEINCNQSCLKEIRECPVAV